MRLGVVGTMVWDRIEHPDGSPVERWGGIAYSLAAAAAAIPTGWTIRPIVKVGADLSGAARRFMEALPGLELPGGVVDTPEPNTRVHLRYRDRQHRDEQLTGGVPPWRWEDLAPWLDGLDALYVNMISGFELHLETALRLRSAVAGRIYGDLHSLLLGVDEGGHRVPRPLARRDDWLSAFDVVQMNETELALVAAPDDPWRVADAAVRAGLRALLVTRGPAGATVVSADRGRVEVPVETPWPAGDPTGCGDVWGATCCVALCRDEPLESAVRAAHRAASRNVRHRGADGLYAILTEAM
jgi:sugar/nucleoside kinase (ribokinase family)